MAKKKTKLDKMSKKEKTSLAYALATNLAKHGKPQTPKEGLTKGQMKKREKNVKKFKKAFDLEEIINLTLGKYKKKGKKPSYTSTQSELPSNYNPNTGTFKEELKNPEKADLNKDGKLSSYEKKRGAAIEKAMAKEHHLKSNPDAKYVAVYGGAGFFDVWEGEPFDETGEKGVRVARFGSMEDAKDYADTKNAEQGKLEEKKGLKIKEGDLDLGHQDNEPHMLKKDLYRITKYASELYLMVDKFDNKGIEVDFPHWWQSKIIKAKEMLISAKHYLDGELKIPQIDAMLEEKKDYLKEDANKIIALEKERKRLMADMEQEAEPGGGPIADEYGAKLDRIDKALAKLKGSKKQYKVLSTAELNKLARIKR